MPIRERVLRQPFEPSCADISPCADSGVDSSWLAAWSIIPHGTSMPPLDGLRVIDLTRVVAGPFCTMMLGDMGAEVLKIEEPKHGDDSRAWAPFIEGTGSFFLALNRSKKSVALDLKTPDGAAALTRLIESADVLIENFR